MLYYNKETEFYLKTVLSFPAKKELKALLRDQKCKMISIESSQGLNVY